MLRRLVDRLGESILRMWSGRAPETRRLRTQEELGEAIQEWRQRYIDQGDPPDLAAWKARRKFEARPFA